MHCLVFEHVAATDYKKLLSVLTPFVEPFASELSNPNHDDCSVKTAIMHLLAVRSGLLIFYTGILILSLYWIVLNKKTVLGLIAFVGIFLLNYLILITQTT